LKCLQVSNVLRHRKLMQIVTWNNTSYSHKRANSR